MVIPLAPEPITQVDGATKNECERSSSKRLLKDRRREHPQLKTLVVEDALAANQPHLSLLESLTMSYVIGVKPGDHAYLFDWIGALDATEYAILDEKETRHTFESYQDVPLNHTHPDFKVTVIRYTETKKNGNVQRFSWVTTIRITGNTVFDLMRAGRSRWRIENETFNTLKNQGYQFEHNYGHGYNNLCSVFTLLMVVAFLVDQVQELCCHLYKKARVKCRTNYALFEQSRSLFLQFIWPNWETFYSRILAPPVVVTPI